ncbi:MAG: DNA repair protein RadC [Alphaproteobacteria bacterium]|nr:DNA repair protein RadC [Alphaproteobacteria bacterium]
MEKDDFVKGHRQRAKEKFRSLPISNFENYELLELLLMHTLPRIDVKPLAKALLKEFGSLSQIIYATPQQLKKCPYIKESSITLFKLIQAFSQRMLSEKIKQNPILEDWDSLLEYCKATMAFKEMETFHCLFLNSACQLILDEEVQKGTVNQTPVYPREILKKALEVGATSVILAHNHPSGDSHPSKADIVMTRKIVETLSAADITVHDHLIISPSENTSLKSLGLF